MIEKIKAALKEANSSIDPVVLQAIIAVETGGKGFDVTTGKIIIQFEPHYFRKRETYAPSGKWSLNGIERQKQEWEAFNDAFRISPNSAMESTSIGLPQIMGAHWARLGYRSVGDMWDDFKTGEKSQLKALIRFIESDKRLFKAVLEKDWHMVAYIYNGSGYAAQAHRLGIKPYNEQMRDKYAQLSRVE